MILVFAGLHGSGKSHLAQRISHEFGWKTCVKRELLKELHAHEGHQGNWVDWYRAQYESRGPYAVTKDILEWMPDDGNIILDSVHNAAEWRAVRERHPDATLTLVVAPKAIRLARNGPEDEGLDAQRIRFWHEGSQGCLVAESEWCFNGAADEITQDGEFKAFLSRWQPT